MAYGDEADIGALIDGLPAGGFQTLLQAAWRFEADGESRTAAAVYRGELLNVLADGQEGLEPYVAEAMPHARWRELNNSRRWGVFYLWKAGAPVAENLARRPKTAEALKAWPQCDLLRTGPTAVFSILDAKTRIPPHVGVNNARLIVHLPLLAPPGCGFRVGGETRSWEPGKAFVFDDSIEHEAWTRTRRARC